MKVIEHKGIVSDVVGDRLDVAVTAQSGCGTCAVRGVCGMSEAKEKMVSVVVENGKLYEVGQQVVVSVEKAMGMKAVLLAYIAPLLVLCGGLVAMLAVGVGEVVAGVVSLGLVAIYYFVLYLLRERIEREVVFKVRHSDE